MTQAERDRLVVLKKAQKKLITQKQAAAELEVTERQVRRLLARPGLPVWAAAAIDRTLTVDTLD